MMLFEVNIEISVIKPTSLRVGFVAWTGKTHCVIPWLDHGVQNKI
ncbi:hypothetical protein [Candidatus Rickettsia colombianensi]|nr:hypothetical protein [Candidatus Rickettsia colombianensi]